MTGLNDLFPSLQLIYFIDHIHLLLNVTDKLVFGSLKFKLSHFTSYRAEWIIYICIRDCINGITTTQSSNLVLNIEIQYF